MKIKLYRKFQRFLIYWRNYKQTIADSQRHTNKFFIIGESEIWKNQATLFATYNSIIECNTYINKIIKSNLYPDYKFYICEVIK